MPENAYRQETGADDPTPEQIAAECAEIQKSWREDEFLRRAGIRNPERWTVPQVRVGE